MNMFVYTDRVNALVGNRGSYVEELRSKMAAVSLYMILKHDINERALKKAHNIEKLEKKLVHSQQTRRIVDCM